MDPKEQAAQPMSVPPVTPIGERPAGPDDGFADLCVAQLKDYPITKDWKLVAQRVTHSDAWGLIWRGEFQCFKEPGDISSNPMVICWRNASGDINIMLAVSESDRA
jgi:hypothetical protein